MKDVFQAWLNMVTNLARRETNSVILSVSSYKKIINKLKLIKIMVKIFNHPLLLNFAYEIHSFLGEFFLTLVLTRMLPFKQINTKISC